MTMLSYSLTLGLFLAGAAVPAMASSAIPYAVMPSAFVGAPCGASPGVPTGGATYYVSTKGTNKNNGLSASTPFRNIGYPFSNYILNPGDVVLVAAGTYKESITMDSGGAPGACITVMGMPGQARPLVTWSNDASPTINVWSPYIRISGLAITHPEPNFNAASTTNTGNSAVDVYSTLVTDANGVWRPSVHHIQIDNNVAYGSGSGGISFEQADYLYVYGNTVYGNSFSDPDQCSGISAYESVNLDAASGYHIIIMDNYSYANTNIQPNWGSAYTTDGNGIIIDDGRQTQQTQPAPPAAQILPYTGNILIFGNVVFGNGGRGIHVYSSDNVDVINNTVYQNLNDPKRYNYPNVGSELSALDAGTVLFENNIAVAGAATRTVLGQSGAIADQASNLWTNDIADVGIIALGAPNSGNADAARLYGVNPNFVNPSTNPAIVAAWGLQLHTVSPARSAGFPLSFSVTDIWGYMLAAGQPLSIGSSIHP